MHFVFEIMRIFAFKMMMFIMKHDCPWGGEYTDATTYKEDDYGAWYMPPAVYIHAGD